MSKKDLAQLRKRLRLLADVMEGGEGSDLSCEECQKLLPAYVEAELEGQEIAARFPDVWRHLLTCDNCGALYADLLEVSMLEETGQLPVLATTSAPDLSFLPSPTLVLRGHAQRIAALIIEHMVPESLPEFDALCDVFFERVQALGDTFQIRSASEMTMAFGTEVSPALPVLAATLSTTEAVLNELETETGQPRYSSAAQQANVIERMARREARRLGLERSQVEIFVAEYLQAARQYLPLNVKDE